MNLLKNMCMAAAMGLLLTSAFAQHNHGGGDDKGKGDGGGPSRGGGGNDRGGGSPPPVQTSPPPPVQNNNNGNDRGNSNSGGGGGSWTPPQRGNDRGNDRRPPVQTGGGTNNGGPTRGGGGVDRGQGGGTRNNGGGVDRGQGGTSNGGPVRSGGVDRGGSTGSGWPTRGNGGIDRASGWPNQGNNGKGGSIRLDSSNKDLFRRKDDARSGRASYGTNHNILSTRRDNPISITRVNGATIVSLRDKVRRSENVSLNIGGVRINYYHYDPYWCDDYFYYAYYNSSPYGNHCVISPWYYYPCLPAYVNYDRCRFYRFGSWYEGWQGSLYSWNRPSYYNNYNNYNNYNDGYSNYRRGTYTDLDYAIDDIVSSFEQMDRRAIGRLIPESGDVAIYVDGNYSYSLNADDFYDMFRDAVENTKTVRYTITKVETNRDAARITARHDYEDPWGRQVSVYHYYELRNERHNMVITRFGVSNDGRW